MQAISKNVIVGTAGHIDHGKTALVKCLTGTDTDRLKEEKQRGITIDIGFADLAVDDLRLGFVDVPGHERFVRNMLAGAHGIDIVMLVVAADEAIMPQTREHFDICRLLNVKCGMVALTKSDLVDADLLELAREEVTEFVRGSFLEGAPIVPVSSRTGVGVDHLRSALVELARRIEPKAVQALPRLPVDRAFSIKGFGTVVTGTLIAGELKVGDEVELLPSGIRARIRNLQVHGKDTNRALAGQRTAVNLQGVAVDQVRRGMVLAPAGRLLATSMIDARLELLPGAPRALENRARVRLHHGTAEVMARVVVLGRSGPGAQLEPAKIEPGKSRLVQLRLEEHLSALPADRFIIRSYSPQVTIAGGVIVDSVPDKHRVRDNAALEYLGRLEIADSTQRIAILVEMAGSKGRTTAELAARTGYTDETIASAAASLLQTGQVIEVTGSPLTLLARPAYEALAENVLSLLSDYHKREPLSFGLSREEVRERAFRSLRPEVFRAVIGRLVNENKVTAERDALRLASHRPALTDSDADAKQRMESAFKAAGLQANTLEEVAVSLKVPLTLANKLYNLLQAEQRVLRLGDMVFHADAIQDLKSRVRARKSVSKRMDVAVFKELTGGLTRKYAIPLLEYLDRERITRRIGNEREIL